jgi:6-phospho-beta-glucosidase
VFAGQGYSPAVMAVVEREGFSDIYRAEDLALIARVKSDYMAFSYYASKTLDSDAIAADAPVNYYLQQGDVPTRILRPPNGTGRSTLSVFAPLSPATTTTGVCRFSH